MALKDGEIYCCFRLFADLLQDVTDDAHNLPIHQVRRSIVGAPRNVQMLADRIFACEILLNELTAHDRLVRALNTFVAGKEPSAHKRNSERAEIAWIDPARQRVGQVLAGVERSM